MLFKKKKNLFCHVSDFTSYKAFSDNVKLGNFPNIFQRISFEKGKVNTIFCCFTFVSKIILSLLLSDLIDGLLILFSIQISRVPSILKSGFEMKVKWPLIKF